MPLLQNIEKTDFSLYVNSLSKILDTEFPEVNTQKTYTIIAFWKD